MVDRTATSSAGSTRRHLIPPQVVARAVLHPEARAAHRDGHPHGHGNGVRLHAIWFALASLVALVLVLTAAALATSSM